MVFVTTADGETGIEAIPYSKLSSDMREADRDLRKKLETVNVLGAPGDDPEETSTTETANDSTPPTSPEFFAPSQEWTNTDGKKITAAIQSVKEDAVVFLMPDGRSLDYPLDKLSQESRERIEAIGNGSE